MHPELFQLPFTQFTVRSYGLMLAIGFLLAVYIIKRLGRNLTPESQIITNGALYALMAGLVGARLFYVIHYFDKFKHNLLSIFAIWQGGLEVLGGFVLAITVILIFLRRHKIPIRPYLDILAIGFMVALAFGRIGCFLNGCCFGKPADLPWAVQFPYGSPAYRSQIDADLKRARPESQLTLPSEFFEHVQSQGNWYSQLKPYDNLTDEQKYQVDKGEFQCLPVHPTQLYSTANALVLCLVLYFFRRRSQKTDKKLLTEPGETFALMLILYGITRIFMENLRDDNPFEFAGLTISQNIGIAMIVFGAILMAVFEKLKADIPASS